MICRLLGHRWEYLRLFGMVARECLQCGRVQAEVVTRYLKEREK